MSQDQRPKHLIVAVDFSEMTDFVIAAAAEQAPGPDDVLHACCVLDQKSTIPGRPAADEGELRSLEEALKARVAADLEGRGKKVRVDARLGQPADEILAYAREVKADVIVLGRHSQSSGRPDFLGSVAARVLAAARCDVLVVQPEDYPED